MNEIIVKAEMKEETVLASIDAVRAQLRTAATYIGSSSMLMQDLSKRDLLALTTRVVEEIQEYQNLLSEINPDLRLNIDCNQLRDEISIICRTTYGVFSDYSGMRKIKEVEALFREASRKCSFMKMAITSIYT